MNSTIFAIPADLEKRSHQLSVTLYMYSIYLSLCTKSADANKFWGSILFYQPLMLTCNEEDAEQGI